MRIKVPITGTVADYNPEDAKLDGVGVSGDPNDPVRCDINLGNVSWRLVSIDLVNDLAEIEVSPGENITMPDLVNVGKFITRLATPTEKQGFLDNAQRIVANHVVDPTKKLVKPANVVKKYMDFQNKRDEVVQ